MCLVGVAVGDQAKPVGDGVHGVDDQFGEQPADFVEGQRNQVFVGGLGRACRRVGDDGEDGAGEHVSRTMVPCRTDRCANA